MAGWWILDLDPHSLGLAHHTHTPTPLTDCHLRVRFSGVSGSQRKIDCTHATATTKVGGGQSLVSSRTHTLQQQHGWLNHCYTSFRSSRGSIFFWLIVFRLCLLLLLGVATLVGRFLSFNVADLTAVDSGRQTVLIHSSTEQRCWSCFSSRGRFFAHTFVLFHALSAVQFFLPKLSLPLTILFSRALSLSLCVNPSSSSC